MKARVKAKQVEVMTNVSQQLIRVNMDYFNEIQSLKKKLNDAGQDMKTCAESTAKILNGLHELKKDNTNLSKELMEANHLNEKLLSSQPMVYQDGQLMYKGILYKRKTSFAEWLFGKHS